MGTRNKKVKATKQPTKPDRGFDLGVPMRAMSMPDSSFLQALRDAQIVGCGYGADYIPGVKTPIYSLTLIGKNKAAFIRAYECFKRWGCEDDGDVVDVKLVLKPTGGYDLHIGSDINRSIHRLLPQADIFEVLSMQVAYIKKIDTTNPSVLELKKHSETSLPYFTLGAAIGDPSSPTFTGIQSIREWKPILKLGVKILMIGEPNSDPMSDHLTDPNRPKQQLSQGPMPRTGKDICARRKRIMGTAFPVTRERIRRSNIGEKISSMPGYEVVTETQVLQAAINLVLCDELNSGDVHYQLISHDIEKAVWNMVASRFETVDMPTSTAYLDPQRILRQLELDARAGLRALDAYKSKMQFHEMQDLLKKLDLIDD